jgi:CubicO group peptidase (beta-lactamase class C family)
VLTKGYGFASFDPVRPVDPATTLFRIGSITKTFTWITLMRAVEAGKIELDAPVNRYLPAELQLPGDDAQHAVRVRDLMTHAAGFDDRVFGVLFARDPESVLPLETFLERYRPDRVRAPGLLSSYSNYGVGLAGALVARVEGLEWESVIERDILQPLGLAHTTGREPYPARADLPAPLAPELARELSNAFRWNGLAHEVRSFEHLAQLAPAGAMSASAADMGRYMLMLLGDGTLDGVTVFGPTAARAFRTPMSSLPPEVGTLDGGFWDSPLPGGIRGYGHGGATLSFFSDMVVVPELRLGVFVATNTEGGAQLSGGLTPRIVEHFYGPAREAPPRSSALDAAEARRTYAGQYLATRRRYGGLEGFIFRLQGRLNVAVATDGFLIIGGAFGPAARYVPTESPDTFRSVSGRPSVVKFVRDDGRATRVETQALAFERVGFFYRTNTLAFCAIAALLVSVGVVIGGFVRLASKPPATARQALAGRVQLATAVLWLGSVAALGLWAASASNVVNIIYDWPGPLILAASTAALVASLLTLAGVALLRPVWRASEVGAWSRWRKARYTLALVSFAALAIVLAGWGALQPWAP